MKKQIRKAAALFLICAAAMMGSNMGAMAKAGTYGDVDQSQMLTPGKSSTDIAAGVTVDYMGKLRFIVKDEDTMEPIKGASVEIYVAGLDRYVLFGQSDENGIYELDAAYAGDGEDPMEQYTKKDGRITFSGKVARFDENQILWKVYKKDYLPNPKEGEVMLNAVTLPYDVNVYLYQEPEETETKKTDETETETTKKTVVTPADHTRPSTGGGIPKTGIQQMFAFWGIGLGLCVIAGILILVYLMKTKKTGCAEQSGKGSVSLSSGSYEAAEHSAEH